MSMTTEMDSETPISHPCCTIIAMTLTKIMPTLTIAQNAISILHVTIVNMTNANMMAIMTPCYADYTKAYSVTIQPRY